jgi:hypothetical protein
MIGCSGTDRGKEFCFSQPPIQRVIGALSLGIKRPGREPNHSPPSSAEVKNTLRYTSIPPIHLHGVVLSQSTGTTLPLPLGKSPWYSAVL